MAGVKNFGEHAHIVGANSIFDDDADSATPTENIDEGPTKIRYIEVINGVAAINFLVGVQKGTMVAATDKAAVDFRLPCAASATTNLVILEGLEDKKFSFMHEATVGAGDDPATPPDVYIATDRR